MARRFLIIGSFAAIYLLWGSTYLAIALGLKSIPPLLLMGSRSLCGGLILVALTGREVTSVSWHALRNAALCGLLFFVGCHGILAFAQQTVPSGVAAIVLATIPFWILLIDFLFPRGKRPAPGTLIAVVPGFAGVALVAWQNVGQNGVSIIPIVWLLISAISWSIATVLSRQMSGETSSTLTSGMQLTIGGIALFAISYLADEMQHFSPGAVSAISIEAAVYLIIAGSVIGFAAYQWLLDNVATSLVSTYTFVNPVVAVLLGTVFLDENFSPAMVFGTGLVVASIIAMWRTERVGAFSSKQKQGHGRLGKLRCTRA